MTLTEARKACRAKHVGQAQFCSYLTIRNVIIRIVGIRLNNDMLDVAFHVQVIINTSEVRDKLLSLVFPPLSQHDKRYFEVCVMLRCYLFHSTRIFL